MAVGLEDPEKYQNSQGFCFLGNSTFILNVLRLHHIQFN